MIKLMCGDTYRVRSKPEVNQAAAAVVYESAWEMVETVPGPTVPPLVITFHILNDATDTSDKDQGDDHLHSVFP